MISRMYLLGQSTNFLTSVVNEQPGPAPSGEGSTPSR